MIQNLPIYAMAVLFVSSLIVLLISMDLCIDVLQAAPKSALCCGAVLLVLASLVPAQILAEIGTGEMLFGRYFLSAPLRLFVLYYIFILILEWVVYKKVSSIKKNQIGKNSIKESMDNLPDGICFSKLDGTPLLVNRQMQEISYDVFGKRLVNDVVCARNIRSNRFNPATKILQWDPLIFESDGKVWQIKIIYHGLVKETLIYNITLEWALYEEIKKISEANRRMNADLKAYQEKIGEYTRQKENLQAKIKIHDRLGQSLIYFRRYLEKQNKTPEDRIRLETLWRESLLLFEEKKGAPKEPSSWDKLISTAKAIGVEVIAEGELPDGEQDRRLLVDFVHEAMNNAIRHGRAKKIRITLKDDGPTFRCRIVNDGLPPQGPIEEKGGLKNMRQRLAYYGGELSVNTDEGFQLDLSWTKGGYRDL